MRTQRIDRETQAQGPVVVVADDDLAKLEQIQETLQERLPHLNVLTTNSVEPSVYVLLEVDPAVVICGLDPDRVRGYDFLRRVGEMAPHAHKLLVTDKHWDRQILNELGILAALREPLDVDTLVDLVGGLIYGGTEAAAAREAAV